MVPRVQNAISVSITVYTDTDMTCITEKQIMQILLSFFRMRAGSGQVRLYRQLGRFKLVWMNVC